jgi:peptidoglycan/LPS O-acetylase OafA/YrhL
VTVATPAPEAGVGAATEPSTDAAASPATERPHAATEYRPDIDGLRAIAVLLTLCFHLDPAGAVRGGFVGVDVFFVISGFLITGLLLRALDDGAFSLVAFYERRVRRIVPALLAIVAVVLAWGYVLLLPGDYRQLARSALWALGASGNLFFLDNTGYFDAAATSMPLLHTWSLGVEEQFYFVWPVLLLVLHRVSRGRRSLVGVALLVVVVASFVLNVRTIADAPKDAFFLLETRAWELGAGGLLALCPVLGRTRALAWLAEAMPIVGLALIARAATSLSSEQPYPGYDALLPVLGAALIVYRSGRATLAGRLLALRPIVFVGKISYSLYLVNWPLIVLFRIYTNGTARTPTETILLVLLSVVLAWLSWRWVEQPFRRPSLPRRAVFTRAALAIAVLAIAARAVVATDGVVGRIPESARGLGDLDLMWRWTCPQKLAVGLPSDGSATDSQQTCVVGAPWETARTRAVLWGDSFADHLLPLLDVAGHDTGTAVALVRPCPAVFDDASLRRYWPEQPTYNVVCAAQRAALLDRLARRADVRIVILSSSWATLVGILQQSGGDKAPRAAGLTMMADALDRLLPQLEAPGRRVVIFADTPRLPILGPTACAVARISPLLRRCPPDLGVVAWQNMSYSVMPTHRMLAEVAQRHPPIVLYRPEEHLCSEPRCVIELNGEFIYRDEAHLRRNLSDATNRQLAELLQLADLLRAPDAPNDPPR